MEGEGRLRYYLTLLGTDHLCLVALGGFVTKVTEGWVGEKPADFPKQAPVFSNALAFMVAQADKEQGISGCAPPSQLKELGATSTHTFPVSVKPCECEQGLGGHLGEAQLLSDFCARGPTSHPLGCLRLLQGWLSCDDAKGPTRR